MIRKIIAYKALSISFLISFLLVFGGWLWAIVSLRDIAQPLILHFSSSVGITETGNLARLSMMAGVSLVIVVINFFLSFELADRDWFLSAIVASATVFVSLLIFIGFKVIISVN